jgi:predicted transglutaminase-like cysteine proteinase
MCLASPQYCQGGGAHSIVAGPEVMAVLVRINGNVNRSIRPRNDVAGDVWSVNVSEGDCEDYVMTKRQQLINAGFPASALRIAAVKTRGGIDHAILVVRTDRGDFALDNLTNAIKPLSQTGHRLISMSGADPRRWS